MAGVLIFVVEDLSLCGNSILGDSAAKVKCVSAPVKRRKRKTRLMAETKISASRLSRILKRQSPDRWGSDYIASIWATPQEAPSISVASTLTPAKLGGRDFHCLSRPELHAALLALYNDEIWEIHEQKMMSAKARPHYLYGHGLCGGMQFPALQGTVDVADRLGRLKAHPKVTIRRPGTPGEAILMPFPLIGDLLLFGRDRHGPYPVNWSIKAKEEDFRRQSPRRFGQPQARGDDEATVYRQLVEATYYADGGIRTQQVAGESIDPLLAQNLYALFLRHRNDVLVSDDQRGRLLAHYRSAIGAGIKIHEVVREGMGQYRLGVDDCLNVLYQGIWERKIKVDLFRRLLNDKPLHAEVEDVLVRYSAWFAR